MEKAWFVTYSARTSTIPAIGVLQFKVSGDTALTPQ